MAMLLAPRRRSTAADLLRVCACWLALTMGLQGLAAAQALGRGPLHMHREPPPFAVAAHAHHHDDAAQHHHAAGDASVVILDQGNELIDAGAFALAAALALLAIGIAWRVRQHGSHWLRAHVPWAWCTASPQAVRRPPRRG
jgi:hypothetical protein